MVREGREAESSGKGLHGGGLPEYRWVVEKQEPVLRPADVMLAEHISIYPEGLTFAENGDLLMAACSPTAAKTFIVRSSDRGETWKQQGTLEHRSAEGYAADGGFVEGMSRLRSGRLVLIYYILKQEIEKTQPGYPYFIEGGNNFRFTHLSSAQWGAYSDDEGKTWRYSPMDIGPFMSMDAEASTQIFETDDGTLVASFRGHLNQAEMDSGITSNGVIRSRDGGVTWGDANPIVQAQPGSGLCFNESQIVPLEDGRWLAMIRLNNNNFAQSPLTMCRSYSGDQGCTWSYPVRTRFRGGEPGMGVLADGAVICVQTGPGWTSTLTFRYGWELKQEHTRPSTQNTRGGLLYEVSCDGGLTWSYWGRLYSTEPGSREHIGSPIIRALDQDTAIAVYHRGEKGGHERFPDLPSGSYGPQFIGASRLCRVPADDPRAAALITP